MWSLHASAGHSASILGVGHFTVPADVPLEGRDGPPSASVRYIVVPHDVVAVPRRSPIKARKRTPWHPDKTEVVVERGGTREWFTDKLFVESKQAYLPGACSTSAIVHVVLVIAVLLLVLAARAARPDPTPRLLTNISLRMPVLDSVMPVVVAPPPDRMHANRASSARPAPPIARTLETPTAAPLETPSSVVPEPAALADAAVDGADVAAEAGAATDGVIGGVAGGTGSGLEVEAAPLPAAAGPLRVGDGIARPRKVRHVKPVYPVPAMSARVGGNVLIEATIGVDGKVHNARVLQSIALLDQAALDAVRQWEFEPSRVDGVPVAVTMVIVVTFALL